jgi:hypothetical protein
MRNLSGTMLVLLTSCLSAQARGDPSSSCTALTPIAIQQATDAISASREAAQRDLNTNGLSDPYVSAAKDNFALLTQAQEKRIALQSFLHSGQFDAPHGDDFRQYL